MDKLATIFGSLPLQKVGTFNLQSENKLRDVYMARLSRPKNTDSVIALLFAEHSHSNPTTTRLEDVQWDTFMVRSYPHVDAMKAAIKSLNIQNLSDMRALKSQAPKWGDVKDVVMTATKRTQDYTLYESKALEGVILTAFVESGSQLGNDLEGQVEIIPVIMSYNFAIQKKTH